MVEGWRAWARALARLRGRANPLSRRFWPGPRHFFLRGRGCACARGRLASGGWALPGRGRHPRPSRRGRRTARIDTRKRHPAQNCRRRSTAPDAGRSGSRLPRAGPARSMARRPRHTVSPARTGPGSLGARRCLRLRCRARSLQMGRDRRTCRSARRSSMPGSRAMNQARRRALAGALSSPRRPVRELPGLAFGRIRIMRSSPRPIACPSPRRLAHPLLSKAGLPESPAGGRA